MMSNATLDSLRHALAHALAHRETITIAVHDTVVRAVAVHDTVVRVASPSQGVRLAAMGIAAQFVVAGIAVLGGWLVQKFFKDRDERRSKLEAERTDEQIRNQVAIGIAHVCDRLRPVRDKIKTGQAVFPTELIEIARRIQAFESVMPRVFQLRDEVHVTQVYQWFNRAAWVPEDLELLAGSMRPYAQHPEPAPLDPKLALIFEAAPKRTRGEAAMSRLNAVLAEGRQLSGTIEIWETLPDGDLVPVFTSRPRRRPSVIMPHGGKQPEE